MELQHHGMYRVNMGFLGFAKPWRWWRDYETSPQGLTLKNSTSVDHSRHYFVAAVFASSVSIQREYGGHGSTGEWKMLDFSAWGLTVSTIVAWVWSPRGGQLSFLVSHLAPQVSDQAVMVSSHHWKTLHSVLHVIRMSEWLQGVYKPEKASVSYCTAFLSSWSGGIRCSVICFLERLRKHAPTSVEHPLKDLSVVTDPKA